jgi:hypothetical protein
MNNKRWINKVVFMWLFMLTLLGCQSNNDLSDSVPTEKNTPKWVDKMWNAHGDLIAASFDFRDASYTFSHEKNAFRYTKTIQNDSVDQVDILTENAFWRIVDGDTLDLPQDKADAYAESLNSVIYFVCLPQKLKDPATILTDEGEMEVHGVTYRMLHVAFEEEGGGTDFEDEFMYWINKETNLMDYFAYRYHTNGGGVRFRSVSNRWNIDGMIFQDYINYEVPLDTAFKEIPGLWTRAQLKELSRIENKNIQPLK